MNRNVTRLTMIVATCICGPLAASVSDGANAGTSPVESMPSSRSSTRPAFELHEARLTSALARASAAFDVPMELAPSVDKKTTAAVHINLHLSKPTIWQVVAEMSKQSGLGFDVSGNGVVLFSDEVPVALDYVVQDPFVILLARPGEEPPANADDRTTTYLVRIINLDNHGSMLHSPRITCRFADGDKEDITRHCKIGQFATRLNELTASCAIPAQETRPINVEVEFPATVLTELEDIAIFPQMPAAQTAKWRVAAELRGADELSFRIQWDGGQESFRRAQAKIKTGAFEDWAGVIAIENELQLHQLSRLRIKDKQGTKVDVRESHIANRDDISGTVAIDGGVKDRSISVEVGRVGWRYVKCVLKGANAKAATQ